MRAVVTERTFATGFLAAQYGLLFGLVLLRVGHCARWNWIDRFRWLVEPCIVQAERGVSLGCWVFVVPLNSGLVAYRKGVVINHRVRVHMRPEGRAVVLGSFFFVAHIDFRSVSRDIKSWWKSLP